MRTEPKEMLAVGIFGGRSRVGDRIQVLLRRGRKFSPRASRSRVAASTFVLSALVLAGSLAPRWIAFAQPAPRPSFEVVSIKPSATGVRVFSIGFEPSGRFKAMDADLKVLLGFAYDLRNHQISGGPAWLDSAKFDIEAKTDALTRLPAGLAAYPPIRLRLQSLLVERFKLVVHKETRDEQIYELIVDKGGSKLKEVSEPGQLRMGKGEFIGKGAPVQLLVNQLSQRLGRSVIDKTGLGARYDFTLKWTPDAEPAGGQAADDREPAIDPGGPSLFTAIQQDLGLKLHATKAPVEILVIDHAEKPDAN